MDEKKAGAAIRLALTKAPSSSIDAGAEFSVSVGLEWPGGTGPDGATYRVTDAKKTIASGALPKPSDDCSVAFTLTAPTAAGEHRWLLTVASKENDAGKTAEGALPFALTVVPHATSLAVWDVPSPVVRGAKFAVKAGAKCTASCGFGDRGIEIRDEAGKLMGSATLGKTTWEGTASLYWTTLEITAPRKHGLHAWTASFSPGETDLPHDGATSRFSFVTVPEPEHSVSVKVVNTKTKAPIANAQVRLGLYRTVTDEAGSAKVRVPKGEFPLIVTRVGYEMPEQNITVSKDVRVRIAAEKLPEEDPFATWTA